LTTTHTHVHTQTYAYTYTHTHTHTHTHTQSGIWSVHTVVLNIRCGHKGFPPDEKTLFLTKKRKRETHRKISGEEMSLEATMGPTHSVISLPLGHTHTHTHTGCQKSMAAKQRMERERDRRREGVSTPPQCRCKTHARIICIV